MGQWRSGHGTMCEANIAKSTRRKCATCKWVKHFLSKSLHELCDASQVPFTVEQPKFTVFSSSDEKRIQAPEAFCVVTGPATVFG